MKLFYDLHYFPCPISIFPLDSFSPWIHFAPYHFSFSKLLNDLHYSPMSHIIFPLDLFCPHIILPRIFYPLEIV